MGAPKVYEDFWKRPGKLDCKLTDLLLCFNTLEKDYRTSRQVGGTERLRRVSRCEGEVQEGERQSPALTFTSYSTLTGQRQACQSAEEGLTCDRHLKDRCLDSMLSSNSWDPAGGDVT